jgi:ATP-dependent Clp protease ATP-binding subunit ClpC
MFERYTEKARRVIFFARYEASQFDSPYIETEHLLLGLLREDKALTNRFLRGQGKVEAIRKQIEDHTIAREKVSTSVDLPLSNEGKRVLAYAAEEAARLSHQHVGTEHLLLGLLREENSFAALLLKECGIMLSRIREELAATTHESSGPVLGREPSSSLAQFAVGLTQEAREEKLLPLIGREAELERVIQVLGRSTKNNPVLVGEPGIGKRTMAEGLAQSVADDAAPAFLGHNALLALDLSLVVAAAQHSVRSKEYLKAFAAELAVAGGGTIFFFDELHALLAAGPAGGAHEITLLLKKALLDGEVRCIASATPEDYRLARKNAPWLDRCFVAVEVQPATEAEAIRVLQASKGRFEKFHGVQFTEDALAAAVVYSNRYINDRFLPGKAIDLIDDAGTFVKMQREKVALPEELMECEKRIKLLVHRMENAMANREFEKAHFYSQEEQKERETLGELKRKHNIHNPQPSPVTVEHIEEVLARSMGLTVAAVREGSSSNPAVETKQPSTDPMQRAKEKKNKETS